MDPRCPQAWPLPDLEPSRLVLVVVGAHPKAEAGDRPIASWLRDRIAARLESSRGEPRTVLVCTDVWYLNDRDLAECPVVSVGGPGVNALSAALGGRIPSVFVIDNVLAVQLDPELEELHACVWGMGTRETAAAAEVFVERYLDTFLGAVTGE